MREPGRGNVQDDEDGGGQEVIDPDEIDLETIDLSLVDRDRLLVHFQPIVSLTDDRIVAVEALLRSAHPNRGLLTATELFGMLVNVPLRPQLADRALTLAAGAWVDLHERVGDAAPDLHVNLDASQLAAADVIERIGHVLVACDLPAERLVVELADPQGDSSLDVAMQRTGELVGLGVRVALDHFGSSSAALAWLRDLPVTYVKIDPSLVRLTPGDDRAQRMLEHLAGLCDSFAVDAIVEGVETEEEANLVRAAGFRYAQGFHFGWPRDPEEFAELMGSAVVEHR
jgi:EAL domain-containing protein (putative c-di-GMP-specific phosphodiesterase class I)